VAYFALDVSNASILPCAGRISLDTIRTVGDSASQQTGIRN
jgi:hypothetical protein